VNSVKKSETRVCNEGGIQQVPREKKNKKDTLLVKVSPSEVNGRAPNRDA
jgi:hypothetical protein